MADLKVPVSLTPQIDQAALNNALNRLRTSLGKIDTESILGMPSQVVQATTAGPEGYPQLMEQSAEAYRKSLGMANDEITEFRRSYAEVERIQGRLAAKDVIPGATERGPRHAGALIQGIAGGPLAGREKELTRAIDALQKIDDNIKRIPRGEIGAAEATTLGRRKKLLSQIAAETEGELSPMVREYLQGAKALPQEFRRVYESAPGVWRDAVHHTFARAPGAEPTGADLRRGIEKLADATIEMEELARPTPRRGPEWAAEEGRMWRNRQAEMRAEDRKQAADAKKESDRAWAQRDRQQEKANRESIQQAKVAGRAYYDNLEAREKERAERERQRQTVTRERRTEEAPVRRAMQRISDVEERRRLGIASASNLRSASEHTRKLVNYNERFSYLIKQENADLVKQARMYENLANTAARMEKRKGTYGFGAIERSFREQQFMQTIGSASQGMMLMDSVSQALEGNITALGFSLIFLQFSMWQVALPAAALTAIMTPLVKKMGELHEKAKNIQQMALQMRLAGQSASALNTDLEMMNELVDDMDFEPTDAREGLARLREEGLDLTDEQIRMLGNIANLTDRTFTQVADAFTTAVGTGEFTPGDPQEFMDNLFALMPRSLLKESGLLDEVVHVFGNIFPEFARAGIEPGDRATTLLSLIGEYWPKALPDEGVPKLFDEGGAWWQIWRTPGLRPAGEQEMRAQERLEQYPTLQTGPRQSALQAAYGTLFELSRSLRDQRRFAPEDALGWNAIISPILQAVRETPEDIRGALFDFLASDKFSLMYPQEIMAGGTQVSDIINAIEMNMKGPVDRGTFNTIMAAVETITRGAYRGADGETWGWGQFNANDFQTQMEEGFIEAWNTFSQSIDATKIVESITDATMYASGPMTAIWAQMIEDGMLTGYSNAWRTITGRSTMDTGDGSDPNIFDASAGIVNTGSIPIWNAVQHEVDFDVRMVIDFNDPVWMDTFRDIGVNLANLVIPHVEAALNSTVTNVLEGKGATRTASSGSRRGGYHGGTLG